MWCDWRVLVNFRVSREIVCGVLVSGWILWCCVVLFFVMVGCCSDLFLMYCVNVGVVFINDKNEVSVFVGGF